MIFPFLLLISLNQLDFLITTLNAFIYALVNFFYGIIQWCSNILRRIDSSYWRHLVGLIGISLIFINTLYFKRLNSVMHWVFLLLTNVLLISARLISSIGCRAGHSIVKVEPILNWRYPYRLINLDTLLLLLILILVSCETFTSEVLKIPCAWISVRNGIIYDLADTLVHDLVLGSPSIDIWGLVVYYIYKNFWMVE